MAEDSKSTLISFWLITLVSGGLWYLFPFTAIFILFISALLISLFSLFFFRDPHRNVPHIPGALISPADGKILSIDTEAVYPGSEETCTHLAVFLNLHDVHVNRIPIDAQIVSVDYRPGQFLKAFVPEANDLNEQYFIEMKTDYGKLMMQQIAGLIARRLICRLIPGQEVSVGEKFGLMKFSSRIDLYFSSKFQVSAEVGQKVRGGESILAKYSEEKE